MSEDARVYDPAYMREPHCAKGQASVTTDTLNVRQGPGTAHAVVGKLARGAVVTIWAVADAWYLVQDGGGLTGWCSVAYLQVRGRLVA